MTSTATERPQPDNVVPLRRALPHDTQAEKAILGAMLLDAVAPDRMGVIAGAREVLDENAFYLTDHGILAGALFELGNDADFVSLKRHFLQTQTEERADELVTLMAGIADQVSTKAGWRHWAGIVADCAERRRLLESAQDAEKALMDPRSSLEDAAEILREAVLGAKIRVEHPTPKQLVDEVWEDLETRREKRDHRLGVLTGFPTIDAATGGLEPRCTYYLIGKSHSGKSALALQVADFVAQQRPDDLCLYITLESQATILTRRRMARIADVHLTKIRRAEIGGDDEWQRLLEAAGVCSHENLWVVDDVSLYMLPRLAAFIESQAVRRPLSLVVVDYIQRMRMPGQFKRKDLEMGEIAMRLNILAKTVKAPVMVLSQVNQDGEAKESRDIYANADNEWRIDRQDQEEGDPQPKVDVVCTKGKDSGLWKAGFYFHAGNMRFHERVRV